MRSLVLLFATLSFSLLFLLAYPFLALALSLDPSLFLAVAAQEEVLKALALSVKAATTATLLLLVTGVPLAYLLARLEFPGKRVLEALIDLPLVVPHAVVGIMLLVAFGPRTSMGELLQHLGVVIEDSFWAIVAVFCFMGAPLLVDCARDGFTSIDPYLEGVARCMGASPLRVFVTISLPLAARSILTGALLAWARAMSEVGALLIIAYYPKTINILVVEWFHTYGLPHAIALTCIILPVSVAVFTLLRTVLGWRT